MIEPLNAELLRAAHQHGFVTLDQVRWLGRRTDEAKGEVLTITGVLAGLAEASLLEAMVALSYKAGRRRVRRMLGEHGVLVELGGGRRTSRCTDLARLTAEASSPPTAWVGRMAVFGDGTLFGLVQLVEILKGLVESCGGAAAVSARSADDDLAVLDGEDGSGRERVV